MRNSRRECKDNCQYDSRSLTIGVTRRCKHGRILVVKDRAYTAKWAPLRPIFDRRRYRQAEAQLTA
jgi:hypothetical protein